jgi:integrase
MAKHLLTDRQVRTAKPKAKAYRLADGDRLYLWVPPSGVGAWQLRYRHNGKQQTATLGKLNTMSLAQARAEAVEMRRLAERGEQLTAIKRVRRAATATASAQTFKTVAAQWLASEGRRKKWSPAYQAEVASSLKNHLSTLNELPVARIVAAMTAPLLRSVERRSTAMADKVSRRLFAIMDYAVEIGAIPVNPLPRRRRGRVEGRNYPAVTDLTGLGEILRAARAVDPCKGIQRAHMLLVFTGQRISEVVGARWDEFALDGVNVAVGDGHETRFDPDQGNWSIPRARMKRKDAQRGPHVVPLPPELLALLRQWREADNGASEYVCVAPRDPKRSITRESCEKHYRDALELQGKHSPHSWRSAFSTVCRDAGKDGDSVEAQLDHVVGTKVPAAYDRAKRLELRRRLMTWYESVLIDARDGGKDVASRGGEPGGGTK